MCSPPSSQRTHIISSNNASCLHSNQYQTFKMTLRSGLFASCGAGLLLLLAGTSSAHHHEECEFPEAPDTFISAMSERRRTYVNPPPTLRAGEMSQLRWGDNGEAVHEFAYRIGLPDSLRREVYDYAERTGIIDKMRSLVDGDGAAGADDDDNLTEVVQEDENRVVTMRNGIKWFFNQPGEHFRLKSNQWWADPADERGHEELLGILARGGFDTVLRAIGNRFDHVDGLAVEGLGFIGVSQCTEHHLHQDFFDREGRMFNVLVPIMLADEDLPPSERQPELVVETQYDDGSTERGEAKYEYDTAFMTGDGMWHSTNTVDYRKSGGLRLTLSVFVADVTGALADGLAQDETALYVQGHGDWLYAQRGRHWTRREGASGEVHSLKEDKGRASFVNEDRNADCAKWAHEGLCDVNARKMYKLCPVSCGVFMDGNAYFNMIREARK